MSDKIPLSFEKYLLLFSSELILVENNIIHMNKLIIDAARDEIFLMVIIPNDYYYIIHDNTKANFEKMVILINDFLNSKDLKINNISKIYVNRGPGSFAGIRNSLSIVKAIHLAMRIDYYCYSMGDFEGLKKIEYKNIPNLCDKFKVKKNLINPIYIS
tara:strand:+ start:5084 stop:5557 length:474 start_codon:yes stop_codon:yes gene_type:complete